MTRISHLPTEALCEITSFLLGNDIERLIMCGCGPLNSKLVAAIEHFSCELVRFKKFPFCAFTLPRLKSLRVAMAKPYAFYPVALDGRSFLPSQPTPRLVSLNLSCGQSFTIFGNRVTSSPLCEIVPNLTKLSLSGTEDKVTPSMFVGLPDTIKELLYVSDSATPSVLSYLSMLPFPRDLESLEIPTAVTIEQSSTQDGYSDMIWPRNFKKLVVNTFACGSILYTLPTTLEVCSISWKSRKPGRIGFSQLPRGLKELTLNGLYAFTVVVDVPLPPQLRVLDVYDLGYPTESEQYEACSEPPKVPFPSFDLVPPSMTSMPIIHKFVQSESPQARLPPALRSAALCAANTWMIPMLPDSLVSLSLPTADFGDLVLETLPPQLQLLSVGLNDPKSLALMPKHLKSLHASFCSEVYVSFADYALLPRHIEEMSLSTNHLLTETALAALPKSLKTIRVTATKKSRNFKDLGMYLPESVTDLRLSVSDLNLIWPKWIVQMSERRIALVSLDIQPTSTDRAEPAFDSSFLSYLPPTLQTLRVSAPTNWVQAKDCLHNLPDSLRTLFLLPVSTSSPALLTDTHFSMLPDSLTYLRVPTHRSLTAAFWKLIPRGIRFVNFGHGDPTFAFAEAKSTYYAEPRWQNIFPSTPAREYEEYDDGPL